MKGNRHDLHHRLHLKDSNAKYHANEFGKLKQREENLVEKNKLHHITAARPLNNWSFSDCK